MGLLDRLFDRQNRDNQAPAPHPLSSTCHSYLLSLQHQFDGLVKAEAEALANLRVLLPAEQAPLTAQIKTTRLKHAGEDFLDLEVRYPKYSIPPHLLIQASPGIFFFLLADNETQEEINREFDDDPNDTGLLKLAEYKDALWVNRDPYKFYHVINETDTDSWSICFEGEEFEAAFFPFFKKLPPPLLAMSGFPECLFHGEAHLNFLNRIIEGYELPAVKPRDLLMPVYNLETSRIPDDLYLKMPLPNLIVPSDLITLKILPATDVRPKVSEQFLESLRHVRHPLAFEIVAEAETVYFQLSCAPHDQELVTRQIQNHFSNFEVIKQDLMPGRAMFSVPVRPQWCDGWLKTSSDFAIDPYTQLFGLLSELSNNDSACVQFLFTPVSDQTFAQGISYLEMQLAWGSHGEPSERYKQMQKKIPLWLATVKLLSSRKELLDALTLNFLRQYETGKQKWFVRATDRSNGIERRMDEWNFIATAELAALAHFPGKEINCARLETASMKAKLPPPLYTESGVVLGISEVRGQTKTVMLPDSVRDRHCYIVGKSGVGKSELIKQMARQDIERGAGVAVIDPHGDLVKSLLDYIPQERIADTIYFDATDKAHPIALNILNACNEEEIERLTDELLTTFRRLSDSWGDKIENILSNSFYTLLNTPGATFLDLEDLLQDPDYRNRIVARVNKPRATKFWQLQFPASKEAVQPILTRLGKFSRSTTISNILSSPESRLNFYDIIQKQQILLVSLSSEIGPGNAQLLGSLIASQLQLAVMRRAGIPESERTPFYLYIDEFQNFTSSAFEKIFSEARKFKLCFTIAHQYISQLDESTRRAIFANVGTMLMFGLGSDDAPALKFQLGNFEPIDLINLPKFSALCRPETAKDAFSLSTLPLPSKPAISHAEAIIKHTRANYSNQASRASVLYAPTPQKETLVGGPPPEISAAAKPQSDYDFNLKTLLLPHADATATEERQPIIEHSRRQEGTKQEEVDALLNVVPLHPAAQEVTPEASMNLVVTRTSIPTSKRTTKPIQQVALPAGQLGRGGQQHKYLQQLIKRLAEDKGFKVTIEQPVLGGVGSVDVSLEKGESKIACEISVTSSGEYELKNIQKCLAAGYESVIVLSSDQKTLIKIKKLATAQIEESALSSVLFLLPEEFVSFLEQVAADDLARENTVRGYKVKVQYKAVEKTEQHSRKHAISQVIMQALRRMKKSEQ